MDIKTLMKCYCKSREMMRYYTDMLQSEDIGDKEKDLIYDLILDNANASLTIRNFCERRFDNCECATSPENKKGL